MSVAVCVVRAQERHAQGAAPSLRPQGATGGPARAEPNKEPRTEHHSLISYYIVQWRAGAGSRPVSAPAGRDGAAPRTPGTEPPMIDGLPAGGGGIMPPRGTGADGGRAKRDRGPRRGRAGGGGRRPQPMPPKGRRTTIRARHPWRARRHVRRDLWARRMVCVSDCVLSHNVISYNRYLSISCTLFVR